MNTIKFNIALFAFLLLGICATNETQAQANWELGVRFGDDFSIDATIPLASAPRLHAAAYLDNDFGLGAYFDWMFALSNGPSGLKFYPGVGPEIHFRNDIDINVAGDFGVEYSFDFPLTIGLDWRPGLRLTNNVDFYSGNWGLIARFRFGEGTKFVRSN